jgi:predicted transcriptional regulator
MSQTGSKNTVVIDVKSPEENRRDIIELIESGEGDATPRISFVSNELLHKVLAPARLELIRVMAGAGPLSIREVARRVGRDFKGVHTDMTALLRCGLVEKTAEGKVAFPYDDVHFDFLLSSAA